jgi:hypothetical protein
MTEERRNGRIKVAFEGTAWWRVVPIHKCESHSATRCAVRLQSRRTCATCGLRSAQPHKKWTSLFLDAQRFVSILPSADCKGVFDEAFETKSRKAKSHAVLALKIVAIVLIFALCCILLVLIHELGHVFTGLSCGKVVELFIFNVRLYPWPPVWEWLPCCGQTMITGCDATSMAWVNFDGSLATCKLTVLRSFTLALTLKSHSLLCAHVCFGFAFGRISQCGRFFSLAVDFGLKR